MKGMALRDLAHGEETGRVKRRVMSFVKVDILVEKVGWQK